MNGLEELKQEVLTQAKEEALRIREEGQKQVEAYTNKSKAKAEAIYQEALQEVKQVLAKERAQKKASLSMAFRQAVLQAKQEKITEAKQKLLLSLSNLNEEDKVKLYEGYLRQAEASLSKEQKQGLWTMQLNAQDQKLFPLLQKKASLALVLDEEKAPFQGGFLLHSTLLRLNYSLEEVQKQIDEELSMDLHHQLFA